MVKILTLGLLAGAALLVYQETWERAARPLYDEWRQSFGWAREHLVLPGGRQ
ncbi:MAG: hypothetical protein ACRD9L_23680 [Bryobacteraceae bacterium]